MSADFKLREKPKICNVGSTVSTIKTCRMFWWPKERQNHQSCSPVFHYSHQTTSTITGNNLVPITPGALSQIAPHGPEK